MNKRSDPVTKVASILCVLFLWIATVSAQSDPTLADRIQRVMRRPEFVHSSFGIEFFSLDAGQSVYSLDAEKLFIAGSTTKLITEGTALKLLGGDFRFHTRLYRTGVIKKNGVLDGDVVLVASGDPNLSGRIGPDDTLTFDEEDHSYGGAGTKGVGTDPLLVVHELAQQIVAKGLRRIKGRVLVDATLFPEGSRELGTRVVISPIVINDNVIDVIACPGGSEDKPVQLRISPSTSYVRFINEARTGKPSSQSEISYTGEKVNPDGTRVVTVTGSQPLTETCGVVPYAIPEPSRFAAVVLAEALRDRGVDVKIPLNNSDPDFRVLTGSYRPENVIAEHVSPPLSEEVKVTLKVSQNLHASMTPFLLGALVAHKTKAIDQAGFDLERDFLKTAGLDLTGASQGDGAGGDAHFTPDFMVRYLTVMSKENTFATFHHALPILGRDGTLSKIQVKSPAAGHVYAKTGTYITADLLNKNLMVTGKGLAGYMETASGQHLAFAIYVNMVAVPKDDPDAVRKFVGEALGEIAAAAYDAPLPSESPK